MSTKLRNFAHDLIAVVGVLLAMQAPLTAYLANLSLPSRAIDLGFGGIGLLATLASKLIDSQSYTAITTATPTPQAAAAPVPTGTLTLTLEQLLGLLPKTPSITQTTSAVPPNNPATVPGNT